MEGYVTLAEAAEQLACNRRTVTRWVQEGKLKGAQLHTRWYVTEESINAYLETLTLAETEVLSAKQHEMAMNSGIKIKQQRASSK